MSSHNPPCAEVAGDSPNPGRTGVTATQVIVIVVVFAFTGWLLARGASPLVAVTVTGAAVTIASTVGRAPRVSALEMLRRLAATVSTPGEIA
ncbi:hypothetical protein [Amycolatopsis thermoflava]|uniref:hypothetical protein n=1 Tax=Amycolatopsis thermoflava TaxID=84480 RepID=UPI0003FD43C4|nr:hypothetical protein [Amycolatopsis thermoflava]